MAKQKPEALYKSYRSSPSLRPVATPVDTFVQHYGEETNGLLRLAESLKNLSPSLDSFLSKKQEDLISEEEAKGAQLAWENSRKAWKDFIKDNPQYEGASPHLRRSYNNIVARGLAREFRDATIDFYMRNPDVRNIDDPQKFTQVLREFSSGWVKGRSGEFDDASFTEGFLPMAESYMEQLGSAHMAWRQEEYRTGIKTKASQEMAGILDDTITSPGFFDPTTRPEVLKQAAAQIEAVAQTLAKDTLMPWSDINQLIAKSVATQAESAGPQGVLVLQALLDPKEGLLKAGTGPLGGIADVRSLAQATEENITRAFMQAEDFKYRQEERARDRAERRMMSDFARALWSNPDADPTQYIGQLMGYDYRLGSAALSVYNSVQSYGKNWIGDPIVTAATIQEAKGGRIKMGDLAYLLGTRQIDFQGFMTAVSVMDDEKSDEVRALETTVSTMNSYLEGVLPDSQSPGLGMPTEFFPEHRNIRINLSEIATSKLNTFIEDYKAKNGQLPSPDRLRSEMWDIVIPMVNDTNYNPALKANPEKAQALNETNRTPEQLQNENNIRPIMTVWDALSMAEKKPEALDISGGYVLGGDVETKNQILKWVESGKEDPANPVNLLASKLGIDPLKLVEEQAKQFYSEEAGMTLWDGLQPMIFPEVDQEQLQKSTEDLISAVDTLASEGGKAQFVVDLNTLSSSVDEQYKPYVEGAVELLETGKLPDVLADIAESLGAVSLGTGKRTQYKEYFDKSKVNDIVRKVLELITSEEE